MSDILFSALWRTVYIQKLWFFVSAKRNFQTYYQCRAQTVLQSRDAVLCLSQRRGITLTVPSTCGTCDCAPLALLHCTGSCLRVQYCLDCKNIKTVLIGLLCHLDCHGRGTLLREWFVVLFFLQLTLSFSLFNKQKLKALNPQCRFVFGHISSRDAFWKFISPDYV